MPAIKSLNLNFIFILVRSNSILLERHSRNEISNFIIILLNHSYVTSYDLDKLKTQQSSGTK